VDRNIPARKKAEERRDAPEAFLTLDAVSLSGERHARHIRIDYERSLVHDREAVPAPFFEEAGLKPFVPNRVPLTNESAALAESVLAMGSDLERIALA